jgi:formate hydrogenlyase transcriptional activator
LKALVAYDWPGNVRELANVVERAVILSSGTVLHLSASDLQTGSPPVVAAGTGNGEAPTPPVSNESPRRLADAERSFILEALREARWVVGGPLGAAARLGLNRTTLQGRMRKLGIARPR